MKTTPVGNSPSIQLPVKPEVVTTLLDKLDLDEVIEDSSPKAPVPEKRPQQRINNEELEIDRFLDREARVNEKAREKNQGYLDTYLNKIQPLSANDITPENTRRECVRVFHDDNNMKSIPGGLDRLDRLFEKRRELRLLGKLFLKNTGMNGAVVKIEIIDKPPEVALVGINPKEIQVEFPKGISLSKFQRDSAIGLIQKLVGDIPVKVKQDPIQIKHNPAKDRANAVRDDDDNLAEANKSARDFGNSLLEAAG